ncbi:MAG: secondary thiamine-phosphate synthase enzyme YjbQ [Candidatus Wallbacteria bacterium]|nr:secondary thiamine-phosphate synthase enzyme YjbQ [Candidatus Wallbacteria bacterium]
MTHTEYLFFNTRERIEFIRITEMINEIVGKSGLKSGLVLINPAHITAAVIVNDDEPGLKKDFLRLLRRLAPENDSYDHNLTGEDNAYAHLWRTMLGHQAVMPFTDGRLDLGPWEQIFYLELDGRRKKKVTVKLVGE